MSIMVQSTNLNEELTTYRERINNLEQKLQICEAHVDELQRISNDDFKQVIQLRNDVRIKSQKNQELINEVDLYKSKFANIRKDYTQLTKTLNTERKNNAKLLKKITKLEAKKVVRKTTKKTPL